MTIAEAMKFIVAMIIMMNPLGSLSVYLDSTRKYTEIEKRDTVLTCGFAITIIMLLTIWSGQAILEILGITIPSFRVAGGLILLLMGLSMLQSRTSPVSHTEEEDEAAKHKDSIAIVPLALPIIIGPGAISTLIISSTDYSQFVSKVLMSALCTTLAFGMGLMMFYGNAIAKAVGESVMKVVTRIMGMLIMAIAVGMLANGLLGLFPALG
jgi:multiple antibiotic resistance protein